MESIIVSKSSEFCHFPVTSLLLGISRGAECFRLSKSIRENEIDFCGFCAALSVGLTQLIPFLHSDEAVRLGNYLEVEFDPCLIGNILESALVHIFDPTVSPWMNSSFVPRIRRNATILLRPVINHVTSENDRVWLQLLCDRFELEQAKLNIQIIRSKERTD